jgi:DnaJ-class molecular chaperone
MSFSTMLDPHQILGVAQGAPEEVLHRAFKKAVRRHHPDLNPTDPGAPERLRGVVAAYQSLLAARARAKRDAVTVPAHPVTCQIRGCDIVGKLELDRSRIEADGWVVVELDAIDACVVCRGSGWEEVAGSWGRVDKWECETCRGGGILRVHRKLRVRVPPKPAVGGKLRLRGIGLPRPGQARGDGILSVVIR